MPQKAAITTIITKMTNDQRLSFDEVTESFTLSSPFFNSTLSSTSNSSLEKKTGGRLFSEVWQHINKGKETSHGHYEGTCKYCKMHWKKTKSFLLCQHLAFYY
jgi:hypothetical protein